MASTPVEGRAATSRSAPTRIAVLGGGAASLAAVHELTRTPGWQSRYAITVYQLGWRCGGKGASGRNRRRGHRIEEHGLHILMGFYDMTFRLLRESYEDLDRRGITPPFGGLERAVTPLPTWQLVDEYNGDWSFWANRLPTTGRLPGADLGSRASLAEAGARALLGTVRSAISALKPTLRRRLDRWPAAALAALARGIDRIDSGRLCGKLVRLAAGTIVALQGWLAFAESIALGCSSTRRGFYVADLACAMARGMLAHLEQLKQPDHAGWRQLDDDDLTHWLVQHGLSATSASSSPLLSNLYRTIAHGDSSLAAGSGLYCVLRLIFTWTGAPQFLMNAGMGDVVFTPLYQLLRERGVRFQFFHRIDNLVLSDRGDRIDAIVGARQLRLRTAGRYEPLYDVTTRGGDVLACWPNEPLWEQVAFEVEGVDLRTLPTARGLESFDTIPGEEPFRLVAGRDFDVIVNGISVAAHPHMAGELIAADATYARHVSQGCRSAVRTFGLQLWLRDDVRASGWGGTLPGLGGSEPGTPCCGTLADPLNGYTDMSHLLGAEAHDPESAPQALAYFWGGIHRGVATELSTAAELDFCAGYVERHMDRCWPSWFEGEGFRWNELWTHQEGAAPMRDQFLAAIPNPSDTYNRSPAGTTQRRLAVDTLYSRWRLLVVGDHVWTRFNIGLVEGAVESGIRAANAILGREPEHRLLGWS